MKMPVLYRCEPLQASITKEQCERNRTRAGKNRFTTDLAIFACESCAGLGHKVKIDLEAEAVAKKKCDVPGCDSVVHAHGKCWRHEREILGIDPRTGKKLVADAVEPVKDTPPRADVTGDDAVATAQESPVAADNPRANDEDDEDEVWALSRFVELGMEIGALVERKQAAYGDSFGKSGDVLRILYPDGIRPDQYDDALGVVRTVDKLFRVATDRDALGESPWDDIAGYGLLGAMRSRGTTVC